MAIDNTHTKYLKGSDKKAWKKYGETLKAQKKLDNWLSGFGASDDDDGEDIEIAPRQKRKKTNEKT